MGPLEELLAARPHLQRPHTPLRRVWIFFLARNREFRELLHRQLANLPGYDPIRLSSREILYDNIVGSMMKYDHTPDVHNEIAKGYNFTDPLLQFGNVSFTFHDFLRHVLWTDKVDLMDVHWMTYTQQCDPCRQKLSYTLRLENIDQESKYILQRVIGYLPRDHSPTCQAWGSLPTANPISITLKTFSEMFLPK